MKPIRNLRARVEDFSLMLITPDAFDIETVVAAAKAGADVVQVRDTIADACDLIAVSKELKRRLGESIPVIVNDRADIAFAVNADGLHVGQRDLPLADARSILGSGASLGLSITAPDQVCSPEIDEADYLGAGPVFPTRSKADVADPLGLKGLSEICTRSGQPVIAVGGITPDNARDVRAAGASGLAVISAVFDSPDPAQAVRQFIFAWTH